MSPPAAGDSSMTPDGAGLLARKIASIFCAICLCLSLTPAAVALESSAPRPAHNPNQAPILDLTSTAATMAAGNGSPVSIFVGGQLGQSGWLTGGTPVPVSPEQLLTPAQFIAWQQVIHTGGQQLLLQPDGRASAGTFNLTPGKINSGLAALTIPSSVIVQALGYTAEHPLNVTGAAIIDGSLLAYAEPGSQPVFNFGSLIIGPSGLLAMSAHSPSESAAANSLTINVASTFSNRGVLSSPGGLTVNAQTIINSSEQANKPVITAANLLLSASSGNIINSGYLRATAGNISLLGNNSNLTIANERGIIEAPSGAVNIGSAAAAGKVNLLVSGGTINSASLNLFAGNGDATVLSERISGQVNAWAGQAHVYASESSLSLGEMQLTGDPAFYSAADLVIDSPLNFPRQNLVLVAGHDIRSAAGAGVLSTSSAAGGGHIIALAGFRAIVSGSAPGPLSRTSTGTTQPTLAVLGSSPTGGSLDLTAGNVLALNTRGTAGDASGGQIVLISTKGSDPLSGRIVLPEKVPLLTGGHGQGTNGSVTVGAGALSGNAIQLGDIDARGGSSVTGQLVIYPGPAAGPFMSPDTGRILIQAGHAYYPPGFTLPAAPMATFVNGNLVQIGIIPPIANSPASIKTGDIHSGGGPALISCGGDISTGSIVVSNDRPILILGGMGDLGDPLARPGNIRIHGSLLADNITVSAGAASVVRFTASMPADLQIRFGLSNPAQSSIRAPAGIYFEAVDGMGVTFSGINNFLNNVYVNAPGGVVTVTPGSILNIDHASSTITAREVVNLSAIRAGTGILLNLPFMPTPVSETISNQSIDRTNVTGSQSTYVPVGYIGSTVLRKIPPLRGSRVKMIFLC